MRSQSKVKLIILLAIISLFALLSVCGFQLVKIYQSQKTIANQQQQIYQLQQQIDNLNNQPESDHETITGDEQ